MPDLLENVLGGFLLLSSVGVEKQALLVPTTPPTYQAEADVKQYNFEGANLAMANFSSSSANGASFRNAQLDYANLSLASLRDVDWTGATLDYALIHLTDLRGARGLTSEQLNKACLINIKNEAQLGVIDGFDRRAYRLPSGCKIWEQALK